MRPPGNSLVARYLVMELCQTVITMGQPPFPRPGHRRQPLSGKLNSNAEVSMKNMEKWSQGSQICNDPQPLDPSSFQSRMLSPSTPRIHLAPLSSVRYCRRVLRHSPRMLVLLPLQRTQQKLVHNIPQKNESPHTSFTRSIGIDPTLP